MIDLHSHILPGVDDGAKDREMSLSMLATAADDGITAIAATPHFIPGAFAPPGAQVTALVAELTALAKAEGIEIAISGGHEVRVAAGILPRLKAGEILALDPNRRYLLVEMPGSGVPSWMDQFLFELEVGDVVPVLAHPERNLGVIKNPDLLYNLVEKGCMVQVTAGSITGRFGSKAQETSLKLLRHDLVHIVASDAHDAQDRIPMLSKAKAGVTELFGAAKASALFDHNPSAILRGADFYVPEPKPFEEKEESPILGMVRKMFGNEKE